MAWDNRNILFDISFTALVNDIIVNVTATRHGCIVCIINDVGHLNTEFSDVEYIFRLEAVE